MVALPSRDCDAFVSRPDSAFPIILLHGPDNGLVAERATALLHSAVDDIHDPFAVTRLDADDIASDRARLVDEALTVPLFGGRRAIHIKDASKKITACIEALLAVTLKDCRVVIEAGDLRRDDPLKKMIDRARNAVSIPCYLDTGTSLAKLIDAELRDAKLRIAPDARAALIGLLGGDRLASRNELRKLTLYAAGRNEVVLDDVRAIITDASALAIDPIADSAFAGHHSELEHALSKAFAAGVHPSAVMSAALRLAAQLHKVRLGLDSGTGFEEARRNVFPQLHFTRAGTIDAAIRAWTSRRLAHAIDQLGTAAHDVRRRPQLAQAITQRTLLALSAAARARP